MSIQIEKKKQKMSSTPDCEPPQGGQQRQSNLQRIQQRKAAVKNW